MRPLGSSLLGLGGACLSEPACPARRALRRRWDGQRIAIARALAMRPDILICDEPVASLDVSIQAQIINLLLELRHSLRLTLFFISHDLSVVRHVCDRAAVMYLGRIVETGPTAQVFGDPAHPYTRALLDSVPQLAIGEEVEVVFRPIRGELPSPSAPPTGCAFHQRCPHAFEPCGQVPPALTARGPGRAAACHLPPSMAGAPGVGTGA